MHDARKDAPSFHKNITPILAKYREILADTNLSVLEIGSGSGQHAFALSNEFTEFTIQPTETEEDNIASITAWISSEATDNVKHPLLLDVTNPGTFIKGGENFDLVQCFNVIHIAPWNVTECLFQLANKVTTNGAKLFLYGPFRIDGKQTSESNEQFELWLKAKNPLFGVRDLADVTQVAEVNEFTLKERHGMPANNFLLEFDRV